MTCAHSTTPEGSQSYLTTSVRMDANGWNNTTYEDLHLAEFRNPEQNFNKS